MRKAGEQRTHPNQAHRTHGELLRPHRFWVVMSEDEGKRKKFLKGAEISCE